MSGSEQERTHRTIERVARESYGRLVAYLSSHTRDVGSAEDALSNALVAALTTWPQATLATSTSKPDMVNVTVDRLGQVFVEDKPIAFSGLFTLLTNRYSLNTNLPVYITGTKDATHGSVIYVLDFVKRAGIRRVAIAVKAAPARP